MKLEIADFALDCVEFCDRYGTIRRSYGCSIMGAEEFRAYHAKLITIIESAITPLADLYLKDQVFRHCCDRCLELNAVDPDWLDSNGLLLEGLLFVYEDGPGLLVRLNQPNSPASASKGEATAGTADLVASLLAVTEDLEKALRLARDEPAKPLISILEARAEQILKANPEAKGKRDREEWAKNRREKVRNSGQAFRPKDLKQVDPRELGLRPNG